MRQPEAVSFARDFVAFVRERRKLWIAPIVLILLLLGTVIVFSEGSALAPFIYAMF
jgi:hypothetical protein